MKGSEHQIPKGCRLRVEGDKHAGKSRMMGASTGAIRTAVWTPGHASLQAAPYPPEKDEFLHSFSLWPGQLPAKTTCHGQQLLAHCGHVRLAVPGGSAAKDAMSATLRHSFCLKGKEGSRP